MEAGNTHTHTHTHIIISHLEYERGLMVKETILSLIPRERSPGFGAEK